MSNSQKSHDAGNSSFCPIRQNYINECISLISLTLVKNLKLEKIDECDLSMLNNAIDVLIKYDNTTDFLRRLQNELKGVKLPKIEEVKPEIEEDKEEKIKVLKQQISNNNQKINILVKKEKEQSKPINNKLSKEEIKEIDEKIKKLEAKNNKNSYCPKELDEIERLYKLKNKEKEEKFKKNIKNGKIVETEEQKELLKKYNELEKKRWIHGDWEGNQIREVEVKEVQKNLKFQKSIFVEDKEYKLFSYSQKHSYKSYRCIIISETDKFYKILPIEKNLTHFDEQQTAHYKYEYPIIIREDKIIKYCKKRYMGIIEYYEKDTDYSMCD